MDFDKIKEKLRESGWATPDTYGNDFAPLPDAPGLYLFLRVDMPHERTIPYQAEVVYVGQSRSICKRVNNHPVKRECDKLFWSQVWFKRVPVDRLRQTEKALIHFHNPKFNIIHRPRGI